MNDPHGLQPLLARVLAGGDNGKARDELVGQLRGRVRLLAINLVPSSTPRTSPRKTALGSAKRCPNAEETPCPN
jgi:hypothetical protein